MTNRESDPVAWLSKCYSDDNEDLGYNLWDIDVGEGCFPVYRAPKQWVGLTEKEIFEHEWWDEETAFHVNEYLKDKNGG